jgi:hypothetical protein
MSMSRIARAASLAFLVAILAHAADFGSSHEPGGRQGAALLHALWAALALLGFCAMLSGALGPSGRSRRAASGVLGPQGRARRAAGAAASLALSVLGLTLGGFAAFCGVESLEGHAPDPAPSLFLTLAAAAALVAFGSRLAARWLAELGGELAALLQPAGAHHGRGMVRLRLLERHFADRTLVRGVRRGRAPPLAYR